MKTEIYIQERIN